MAWLLLCPRVEPEELEAMVQAVPKRATILGKMDGRWEVRHWRCCCTVQSDKLRWLHLKLLMGVI